MLSHNHEVSPKNGHHPLKCQSRLYWLLKLTMTMTLSDRHVLKFWLKKRTLLASFGRGPTQCIIGLLIEDRLQLYNIYKKHCTFSKVRLYRPVKFTPHQATSCPHYKPIRLCNLRLSESTLHVLSCDNTRGTGRSSTNHASDKALDSNWSRHSNLLGYSLKPSSQRCYCLTRSQRRQKKVSCRNAMAAYPANTKHLYNIYTMLDQRRSVFAWYCLSSPRRSA